MYCGRSQGIYLGFNKFFNNVNSIWEASARHPDFCVLARGRGCVDAFKLYRAVGAEAVCEFDKRVARREVFGLG